MRIISKHHDYYDSCLAYGQDESVVYSRSTQEFDVRGKDIPTILQTLRDICQKDDRTRYLDCDLSDKKFRYKFEPISLFFCGKLYNGFEVVKTPKGSTKVESSDYIWNVNECISLFDSLGEYLNKRTWMWSNHTKRDVIGLWYTPSQPNIEFMIENKVTCVLVTRHKIVIDPCLKNLQFYRVFDSYSAYQELDTWISGTLSYPQNMMVSIGDKYRIEQHGFDMKYGFRTRPKEYK